MPFEIVGRSGDHHSHEQQQRQMPRQRAPPSQHHFGGADQQHQRYVQIAVRHPADHGNIAPSFGETSHRIAPIVIVQMDPLIAALHVIVVHVVVHRHVR